MTLSAVCHCDKYTPDLLFFEADGTDKLLFHNVALTRLGALAVKSSPMMVLLSEPQPWLLQSGLVAGHYHDYLVLVRVAHTETAYIDLCTIEFVYSWIVCLCAFFYTASFPVRRLFIFTQKNLSN